MACSHKHDGCTTPVEPSARGKTYAGNMFFLKADNCSPQARAVGNIFPIDFLLKYAILDLVGNCVWSAGTCLP